MSTLAVPLARYSSRLIPAAVALILGGALLSATLARLSGYAAPPAPPPIVATRLLTFTDLINGGIAVHTPATGARIATIPARDDGFLRMTLRLLAAARQRQHIGRHRPFELTEFAGGRMQLRDPATGLQVELEAFGPSNVAEFAQLLPTEPQP